MTLLIQIIALVFHGALFLWVIKLYRQILNRSGPYYLGVLKIGTWAPTFLKYAGPLLILLIALQFLYISMSLIKDVF